LARRPSVSLHIDTRLARHTCRRKVPGCKTFTYPADDFIALALRSGRIRLLGRLECLEQRDWAKTWRTRFLKFHTYIFGSLLSSCQ